MDYRKIVFETRRKASKLTLDQQKQLLKLYDDAIKSLSKKARRSKSKSLTNRWVLDYQKQLKAAKKELRQELNKIIRSGINEGAKLGTEPQQLIMKEIFRLAGIEVRETFINMFSQVQDNIVHDIISGNLYKDSRTLSARIWSYGEGFENDIQYVINQAILEKKSAIELARDLEKYVLDPAKRETDWGSAYPNLRHKKVDYNAMRLARTSINHSYQTASIQSSNINPFVEGIQWHSAMIHGRTCELCMERHGQVFPVDDVPLDHPNGLCTMIPYIPKDLDTVAEELRNWVDGGSNPKLDKWYKEYGDYFAFKR